MSFGFLVVRHPRSPRESTTFPAVFSQFPAGSYLSGISRFPDPGPRPGIRRGTCPSLPSVLFVCLDVLAVTLPFLVPRTTKHNAQDAGAWRGSSLSLTSSYSSYTQSPSNGRHAADSSACISPRRGLRPTVLTHHSRDRRTTSHTCGRVFR